jgi:hypothetical protein
MRRLFAPDDDVAAVLLIDLVADTTEGPDSSAPEITGSFTRPR